MSPYSTRSVKVGAICDESRDWVDEWLTASYSNKGPAVDIYAAGSGISSCTSTSNEWVDSPYVPLTQAEYFLNGDYKQATISGTSMAAPQLCGMGALFLQANPGATSEQFKNWVNYHSKSDVASTVYDYDYGDRFSLWGGTPRVAYNIFNSPVSMTIKRSSS
jgi:hypothetical protein